MCYAGRLMLALTIRLLLATFKAAMTCVCQRRSSTANDVQLLKACEQNDGIEDDWLAWTLELVSALEACAHVPRLVIFLSDVLACVSFARQMRLQRHTRIGLLRTVAAGHAFSHLPYDGVPRSHECCMGKSPCRWTAWNGSEQSEPKRVVRQQRITTGVPLSALL